MTELADLRAVYERSVPIDAPSADGKPPRDVGFMARAAVRASWLFLAGNFFCQPDAVWPGLTLPGVASFWDAVVSWTARVVFHDARTLETFADGVSGPGLYGYYHAGTVLILAIVGGSVWAALGARHRANVDREARLRAWLWTTTRVFLALNMFSYGFAKLFPQQFAAPGLIPPLEVLAGPYGQNSPMNILWWFMAHSRLYQVWGGALEVLGGILLLRPKTASGGALLLVGVLGNVVFLDYGFHVSPRFYALQLWILSLILAAPAVPRAIDAFIRNVPTVPDTFTPLFAHARTRRIVAPILVVYVITIVFGNIRDGVQSKERWTSILDSHIARTLSGIYDVTSFVRGADTLPALLGGAERWHRVIVEPNGTTVVQFMNDRLSRYWAQIDTTDRLLTLRVTPFDNHFVLEPMPPPLSDSGALHFRVDRVAPTRLILRGQVGADSVTIALQREDDPPLRRPRSFFIDTYGNVASASAR